MVGPGAMFGGMNPPPQAGGWRNPMEQGMQQSFPQMPMIDPRTGTVARPMQGQQAGAPMQGQQALTPEMRGQQNEMVQELIRQKQLEQMFRQREMRGLLSDPGSVVRPGEMRPDPRSVVREEEMGMRPDPRSVVREQEYSDPRADPGLEGLRFIQEQMGGGMY